MKFIKVVSIFSFLVFFVLYCNNQLQASESDQEKLQAIQQFAIGDRKLIVRGMGLTRMINEDYYIGAFYVDESSQPTLIEDLIYLETTRSMKYRFVSERKVSARGFGRKMAEAIRINNEAKDIKLEGKNLNKFLSLFKGSYKKGDEIRFDYSLSKGTLVYFNNKLLGEFRRSARLYSLILNTWIGDKPPSNDFKIGILGENPSNKDVIKLQRRFVFIE